MKAFVKGQLIVAARKVLKREQTTVIGVTGSVGKSSAKQAIGAVLSQKFVTRVSQKNYNTEFGLPLAVLDLDSGESSAFKWARNLLSAWKQSMFRQKGYPDTLVLEMGADKPGDIRFLTEIAPPKIGVVTTVGESHAEFLGGPERIAKEKRVLIEALPEDGTAILNRDDDRVWAMRDKTKAQVLSFGFHEEADVRAIEVSMTYTCDVDGTCGMRFKLAAEGATVPMFIPHVIGRQAIYAALVAAAVGLARGMNLVEVGDRLREYEPPPGRMRLINGIKRTMIIDDTYNSAPKSAKAALLALQEIPVEDGKKRFAVLGDMLELGDLSEHAHREIGRYAAEHGVDILVLIGELMGEAEKEAVKAGMPEGSVLHFSTNDGAGRFVQERMKEGDVVLVKGSRGMRMEEVVKELMAAPGSANALLVGFREEWDI